MDLVAKMTKAQVIRSGATPLMEAQGSVTQGQTVSAGVAVVPDKHGDLETILAWPGSELEVVLTDPSGSKVASGYPGFSVAVTERTAQVKVDGAKPGEWTIEVYGKRTSMADEPFYAVAAFKETSGTAPAVAGGRPTSDGAELWLLVLGVAAAGAVGLMVLGNRKRAAGDEALLAAPAPSQPLASRSRWELRDSSQKSYPLAEGVNVIGRASDSYLVLSEPSVSRRHALVTVEGSQVSIRNLSAGAGTMVNGVTVTESPLFDGDAIGLAGLSLTLVRRPDEGRTS
jgi:hypothetical protein